MDTINLLLNKDDVLTLLVHLVCHLAYDQTSNEVYIPNRGVSVVFQSAVKGEKEAGGAGSFATKAVRALRGE